MAADSDGYVGNAPGNGAGNTSCGRSGMPLPITVANVANREEDERARCSREPYPA